MKKQINGVEGCVITFSDNIWTYDDIYASNKSGQIVINSVTGGGEETEINILYIPEDYEIEETTYYELIDNKEEKQKYIQLKHKKGSICIETNTGGTFEIYNTDFELVGTYQTDSNNEVYIDNINTGTYLLRQIEVEDGYEKINDITLEVTENEVTNISILNEEAEEIINTNVNNDNTEDNNDEEQSTVIGQTTNNEEIKISEKQETDNKDNEVEYEDILQEIILNEVTENTESEDTELIEETQETVVENISGTNEELDNIDITTLPRTGEDYFNLQVVLFNIVICSIAGYLYVATCNKRKFLKNNTN